mgnify:FL=1
MLRKRVNMLRRRRRMWRKMVINNLMRRRGPMLRKRVHLLRSRKRRWLMLRCWFWTNEGLEQMRRWGCGQ